jgi:flagellar biosynthesis protein FlhG
MVIDPRCKASLCVQHIVERMEKNELRESGGLGAMMKKLFGRSK